MNLTSIETGYFKLDGDAMFGVIPKVIWNKSYPANENNLIDMAMRSLLIIDGDRKILIDSGIGNKQSPEFLKYYYLHGDHTLEKSLADAGVHPDEITDNIITHLHFDHCGGSVVKRDGKYVPAFRNASYWISKSQWETALNPNAREGATYFRENFVPLQEAGKLKLIDKDSDIYDNISVKIFDGHTDGQIIPFIKTEKG
ncbi:MAG: MBL fold metallo-hydrolase, partial [Bacteroidota bacterium]